MAKLVCFTVLFLSSFTQAKSLQLDLFAQTTLPEKVKVQGEAVGGISGIIWNGSKLVAVCDDRGKFGSPRLYELALKIIPAKAELSVLKVHHLKNAPKDWILDLEAIATLPNGELLLSTEGDNNQKPRAMPHIFVTSLGGDYKFDIALPDKYLPEPTGLQKKGIENNKGFESLTASPLGQYVFTMSEYPILEDQGDDEKNFWLRLVELKKDKKSFKVTAEYPYLVTKVPNNEEGIEIFRGVAEILFTPDDKLIVLERGARLGKTGVSYTGSLYLTDTRGAKDVSKIKNLSDGKSAALKKEKLVDFEELFKNQKVENFEGLAWGSILPDGRKSLLVISDNNFSSKEKTTLLVFAVKEVE